MCIRDRYENGVLITDMDMLPLSTTYYTDLSECSNNNFACFRRELITKKGTHINQLPICYNIATPSIWSQVFNVKTMEDLKETLISYRKTRQRWCTDQSSLYTSVMKWNAETGNYIPLMKTGGRRLDFPRKGNIDYSLSNITKNTISQGGYTDFHCPRPYEKYKELIDEVLNFADKNNKKLNQLTIKELKKFNKNINLNAKKTFSVDESLKNKKNF